MIMWIFLVLAVVAALIVSVTISARPVSNFVSDVCDWFKAKGS